MTRYKGLSGVDAKPEAKENQRLRKMTPKEFYKLQAEKLRKAERAQ